MGQQRPSFVEHLQRQLVPRAEADRSRHAGLLATTFPLSPLLGQVQADIDQGVLAAGDVAEVDADLAVVDLAQPAAPLPLYAHRFAAFLGEGRRVKNEYRVGLAPFRLADELLQALAFAVVQAMDSMSLLPRSDKSPWT